MLCCGRVAVAYIYSAVIMIRAAGYTAGGPVVTLSAGCVSQTHMDAMATGVRSSVSLEWYSCTVMACCTGCGRTPGRSRKVCAVVGADMADCSGAGSAIPPKCICQVNNRRIRTTVTLAVICLAAGTAGGMTFNACDAINGSMRGMTSGYIRINGAGRLAGAVYTCSAMTTTATVAVVSGVCFRMTGTTIWGRSARGRVRRRRINVVMTAGSG